MVHQIGGSLHAAEIHWVHVRNGTDDELLVVGVLMDVIEYGTNVEVCASHLLPHYPPLGRTRIHFTASLLHYKDKEGR